MKKNRKKAEYLCRNPRCSVIFVRIHQGGMRRVGVEPQANPGPFDSWIKEMLGGKSREELSSICHELLNCARQRNVHISGLRGYIYSKDGTIPSGSDALIEFIVDISWKLRKREFGYQRYMKTLFTGRQKGRAYKTF